MITIVESDIIQHAPPVVFAVAADPHKQLEWDPGTLTGVEKLTPGPLGLGSRYRGNFKGFGLVEYTFVEFEPGRRFAHVAELAIGAMRHTFTVEPDMRGTRLTQEGQLTPRRLGRLLGPLMPVMLRRRFREIANEIDRYLSAVPAATDGTTPARQ